MSFSASEIERQHYTVMSAVLENPSEKWSAIIERLGITKEQLFSSLDYLDREGYVSGMKFARGGQKRILVPFTEQAAITERGIAFMKRLELKKDLATETTMCPTVFVSYNDKSGKAFVDALEAEAKDIAQIIRYTDMGAWQSFKEFMNSIRRQDFAILVITDAYLKSYACLYEVMELMKDANWTEKTMFIIFDDAYDAFNTNGRASYIAYWTQKCKELEVTIKSLPPSSTAELSVELKKSELIRNEIGSFLSAVSDANNPPMYLAISKVMERIRTSAVSATCASHQQGSADTLDDNSLHILSLACDGDGIIISTMTLSGYSITINNTVLLDNSADNREIARWKAALNNLVSKKMIEATNYKNEIYRVTDKGYKAIGK